MLRKLFRSIIVCFFVFSATTESMAQGSYFTHAIHGGILLPAKSQGFDFGPFVGYAPRRVLKELGQNSSIGINSYIKVGTYDQKSNFPGFYELTANTTFVSVPLLLQYDFGAGATRYGSKKLGFYAGAGLDYSSYFSSITQKNVGTEVVDKSSSTIAETSFMGTGGIRLGRSAGVSIRGSYLMSFSGNDYMTAGIVIHLGSGGDSRFKGAGRSNKVGSYSRRRQQKGRAGTWSKRLFRINKPSIQRDRPTPFHRTYYR